MTNESTRKQATMNELVQRFVEEKKKASGSLKPLINMQAFYKEANRLKSVYDKMQERCQAVENKDDAKQRYELLEKRFDQMNSKNAKLRARNTLLEHDKEAIVEELERLKTEYNVMSLEVNRLRGLNASLKKKGEDPELVIAQLKQRNSELQQQNNELLNKLASGDDNGTLQDTVKVQILQKDINELKCVIHELEDKNENLQRDKFEDVDKLKAALKERDERYRALKLEYEQSLNSSKVGEENAMLKQKLADAQLDFNRKLEVETEKLAKRVKEQALQLQQGSANMQELNEENNQLNDKVKGLLRDNCALHKQMDDLLAKQQAVAQQQEAHAQQTVAKLEADNRQLKAHIKFLLEDVQNKAQTLEQLNSGLKERKLSLENDVEELRRELNKALDLVRIKTQDVANIQATEAKYKQKIGQLEEELQKLTRQLGELSERERQSLGSLNELRNREVTYRQKLARLEKDNGQLKTALDDLNAQLTDKIGQLEEIRELHQNDKQMEKLPLGTMDYMRGLIAQLHQSNNALHKSYDAALQENNQLKLKLRDNDQKLQQDNQTMANKLDEAAAELYRLREEIMLLKQDINTTEEENKSLKLQCEKQQLFKQKIALLEKDNSRLKSELDKVQAELQAAKRSSDEYVRLKKRITQLEQDAAALQSNKDGALQQQRELSELINVLKEKLRLCEADNAQLKRDLKYQTSVALCKQTQADKTASELKEQNWALAKQVDDLKTLLDNALKRCENHSALLYENKELQIKLRDMDINLELLHRDLDSCADEIDAAEKRNHALMQECTRLKQRLKTADGRDCLEKSGAEV